jgi:hypothetical protein
MLTSQSLKKLGNMSSHRHMAWGERKAKLRLAKRSAAVVVATLAALLIFARLTFSTAELTYNGKLKY